VVVLFLFSDFLKIKMEHRVKKPVDYKVLNTKGKVDDVFDISTEMTPIKSKSVSKIETIALIHDDLDDGDGAEDNGSAAKTKLPIIQKSKVTLFYFNFFIFLAID
jgi:hypothetical protein